MRPSLAFCFRSGLGPCLSQRREGTPLVEPHRISLAAEAVVQQLVLTPIFAKPKTCAATCCAVSRAYDQPESWVQRTHFSRNFPNGNAACFNCLLRWAHRCGTTVREVLALDICITSFPSSGKKRKLNRRKVLES